MRQPWEVVADALQRAISDKTYEPGDRLPSESQSISSSDTMPAGRLSAELCGNSSSGG